MAQGRRSVQRMSSATAQPSKFDANKRIKVQLDKKKTVNGNATLSFPGMKKIEKFSIEEANKLFERIRQAEPAKRKRLS